MPQAACCDLTEQLQKLSHADECEKQEKRWWKPGAQILLLNFRKRRRSSGKPARVSVNKRCQRPEPERGPSMVMALHDSNLGTLTC